MNKILCFDVSNNLCSVSVAHGQEIIAYAEELCPAMQAEKLIGLIECAIKDANCHYEDMSHIATTIGPGSFTGIRIGLSVAKALCHVTKRVPVGITNFQTYYYKLRQQVRNFDYAVIFLNAYRGQQYMQIFDRKNNSHAPKLVNNQQINAELALLEGNIVCAGSGLHELYGEINMALESGQPIIMLPRFNYIKAYNTARLADLLIKKNNIAPIEPLYIRPPDAIPQKHKKLI